MDEPTTGLDYCHQLRLLDRLNSLAADGYGVLMTSHHPEHVLSSATRVLLMRDGRIEAAGAPQEVLTPENIQRLYGIAVDAIRTADGRCVAFSPTAGVAPDAVISRTPAPPFSLN